jgi:response regulator of citrate/malate metabolism
MKRKDLLEWMTANSLTAGDVSRMTGIARTTIRRYLNKKTGKLHLATEALLKRFMINRH